MINLLSETTRTIALVLNMYHDPVDHNQVCTNYAPGAKIKPATEGLCFTQAYKGKT